MFFCWNTLTPKRRISLWNFNWTWTAVQNSLQVLSVFVNMWASISITGVLPPSLTPCSSVRPIPMFGPSRHTQKPFCLIQSSIQGSIYLSKFGNENNNCVLWKTDKFRNFLVIQFDKYWLNWHLKPYCQHHKMENAQSFNLCLLCV